MTETVDRDRIPAPLSSALDGQREHVIQQLQDAFAVGHMTMEELDERLELAQSAKNDGELAVLTRDLPAVAGDSASTALVSRREEAPLVLTAIFGGTERRGEWTPPPRMRARAIFGGVEIDLCQAHLAPGSVTEIVCTAIFGGIEVRVSPKVRVQTSGIGIFGGFQDCSHSPADADAPLVRITGKAVFGGVEVKVTKPKARLALPRM